MKRDCNSLIFVLILVAGLVIPVIASTAPAFAQGQPSQEATGGFGNTNNDHAGSAALFQSKLFVGTVNNASGLEVYSFDGAAWVQEVGAGAPGSPTAPGFGNAANFYAASMIVYGSSLYVGTGVTAGACEIWRYDGTAWTAVVGGTSPVPAGFGNANNVGVMCMETYGTDLYAGIRNSTNGCEVWRYDGTNWTPEVGGAAPVPAGFGNVNNVAALRMRDYGTHLYVGTLNSVNGCAVWRHDGLAWVPVVGGGAPMGPGFGSAANHGAVGMAVYEGMLYAGTQNNVTGCEVWAYDGTNWIQSVGALPSAVAGPGFGNAANSIAMTLSVYDSKLVAGTYNLGGCEVWAFDSAAWVQEVGGGAPGTPTGPGFGNAGNDNIPSMAAMNNRLYMGTSNLPGGCEVWSLKSSHAWYLAEGATAGGFETWVLVQNPNPAPVNVQLTFQTGAGAMVGPADIIPANSRRSYLVNSYVDTYDVSTKVEADGDIVCERSMYWKPEGSMVRVVGHDSIGVVNPASTWYLAEGATAGYFETWVLVQKANDGPVNIDMKFQTDMGEVQGPLESIPARSRRSYPVDNWVTTYDVSTRVTSTGGAVVCERAMYEAPTSPLRRVLGHDSIGTTAGGLEWYLAEGATLGGFETWVLVQNPNPGPVDIDIKFQTDTGEVQGPVDTIPAFSRKSYLVNLWTSTYDVSTKVTSTAGGPVICERAVYWRPHPDAIRYLGTDSIGYSP